MRLPRMSVLLVLLAASAGCASDAVPAIDEDAAAPAPREAAPEEELLLEFSRGFAGNATLFEERFVLDEGHWLCVDAIASGEGEVDVAVHPPEGEPWTILQRGGNQSAQRMVPGLPGEYVVRVTPGEFVGTLWVRVTNVP